MCVRVCVCVCVCVCLQVVQEFEVYFMICTSVAVDANTKALVRVRIRKYLCR